MITAVTMEDEKKKKGGRRKEGTGMNGGGGKEGGTFERDMFCLFRNSGRRPEKRGLLIIRPS
jgi:hypothetical protein